LFIAARPRSKAASAAEAVPGWAEATALCATMAKTVNPKAI
jgi:hypothetical protein